MERDLAVIFLAHACMDVSLSLRGRVSYKDFLFTIVAIGSYIMSINN